MPLTSWTLVTVSNVMVATSAPPTAMACQRFSRSIERWYSTAPTVVMMLAITAPMTVPTTSRRRLSTAAVTAASTLATILVGVIFSVLSHGTFARWFRGMIGSCDW